jgi:hypothetical protein
MRAEHFAGGRELIHTSRSKKIQSAMGEKANKYCVIMAITNNSFTTKCQIFFRRNITRY